MGSWLRNLILLTVIVTAFSGLVMADYFLRHESTGQTRRALQEQGVVLNSDAVLQAAGAGNLDRLESLRRVGVDLGGPGASGDTALIVAVEAGDVEVRDYLLGKKSVARSLEHKGSAGQTALLCAVEKGDFTTAEKLIEHGRSWAVSGKKGRLLSRPR